MPDITFVQADGTEQGLEAPAGVSLMQAATGAGVPGIIADCGGLAVCATCHVYVDPIWLDRLGPVADDEDERLEYTAAPRLPNSRLSCQVRLTDQMQGLRVSVPKRQY